MTYPAGAAYLDALTGARRADASAYVLHRMSDVAMHRLHAADSAASLRLISEALEVLAGRLGVDMHCVRCTEPPARNRDHYPGGALCDDCSAKSTAWICSDCGETSLGDRTRARDHCFWCGVKRKWEALPQAVRDEVRPLMDDRKMIPAIKRLRELAGFGIAEASELVQLPDFRELD